MVKVQIPLEELFGQEAASAKAVFVFCPFHGDEHRPNLAVYRNGTYCFACGFRETPEQFLARVQKDPSALIGSTVASRAKEGEAGGAREEAIAAWHYALWEGARRERQVYLAERGISLLLAREVEIGHDGEAFVIPYRDRQGNLIGYKRRADPLYVEKGQWRYKNSPGLGTAVYRPRPGQSVLAVCEGELDTLLLASYGFDAVTVSTGVRGFLSRHWPLLDRGGLLFLDWDEAGEEVARELLARYPRLRRVPRPPGVGGKDIGEWLAVRDLDGRGEELHRWVSRAISSTSCES